MTSAGMPMLSGIKVLDLSNYLFAPYCTQTMADLGADVVKVEPPGGDLVRYSGASQSGAPAGPFFMATNRNKRSVEINMRDEAGRAAVDRMIAWADVVIHNIRQDYLPKLRLTYEDVKAVKDDIIYVHCVGYGAEGPYGGKPVFDPLIQASTGMTELLTRADGNPEPRFLPMLVADKTSSIYAMYGTMAAIIHKLQIGEGQFVEVPMFEAMSAFVLYDQMFGHTYDPPNGPMGFGVLVSSTSKPIKTKDGYMVMQPFTDRQWASTLEAIGRPELNEDDRFNSIEARIEYGEELGEVLRLELPKKTNDEWLALFEQADIPAMPTTSLEDLIHDKHLQEVGLIEKVDHPTEGPVYTVHQPINFSAHERQIRHLPPAIGEHSEEVLREMGFSVDEISALLPPE